MFLKEALVLLVGVEVYFFTYNSSYFMLFYGADEVEQKSSTAKSCTAM